MKFEDAYEGLMAFLTGDNNKAKRVDEEEAWSPTLQAQTIGILNKAKSWSGQVGS